MKQRIIIIGGGAAGFFAAITIAETNPDFEVTILENKEHVQGGCMVPVNILADAKVQQLIVGGIGMRPLQGFNQAGIDVYYDGERRDIRPVVEDMIAAKLPVIGEDQVCGGGGGK